MQQLQAPPLNVVGSLPEAMLDNQAEPKEAGYESDLTDLEDIEPPRTTMPSSNPKPSPPCKKVNAPSPKPSKGKRPGKKPKPRTHEIPQHLRPDIPAHTFRSKNRRRSIVAHYLHGVFENARVIHADFDMAVAFFLQQVHHLNLGDIPISVNTVLADFSVLEPLNGRQDSILLCAHHIRRTLDEYAACPRGPKPFALRFPNLTSLNQLAIERSISPEVVGKDEAVVLIDLAGRVAAVGIPPKERGCIAFSGAAVVHDAPPFIGPMTWETFQRTSHPPPPIVQSPYQVSETASTRLSGAAASMINIPGTINGMSDTQMQLGLNRQGHPSSGWEHADVSHYNLPTIIQMGKDTAYKCEEHERTTSELLWYLEMGRLIIKSIQPHSYSAAMAAVRVIVQKGTPAASRELKNMTNPLGIGRHVMFGMQVDHHRDGNNACLFASANFFGENYGGGELILNYLGYAIHGGPGYSVHGAFDILMHGVGQITRLPTTEGQPLQRICMAIYSHADVFAGAARFAGMQQEPKLFSDRRLWIPFYPAGFSLTQMLQILNNEEKRLHEKYRQEVRAYKAALKAAEEAAKKCGALNYIGDNNFLMLRMDQEKQGFKK
ncbi:uncharacterized protein MELLADRAFT_114265 [Melampsora larici-populina 98AG31]|uniref:Uncharacterized protein n=1 Tax=Melampsora larici-populina (strain 98AG31 / pathotype 3-4-7) TaxID=747676 RepID=F4SCU7_MELLP|nr:uncharacterized protein MELLADRAFT_114265 [Melampsora larici-populina 98AG31]EGF97528.1 hypothetical protein MELLADRAFT_114265 [Melampsora larici-populina 98AG31]